MKILYYNWAPLIEGGIGGGVAVYMRNLLRFISSNPSYEFETVFLSSGYYYDNNKNVYLRREANYEGTRVYSIVNSPVMAPLSTMISQLDTIHGDKKIQAIFEELFMKEGVFDVVHLQTFEGISPNVLSLKMKYPQTKFIHSIHDYGIVCPNVRLWRICGENCYLHKQPYRCQKCMSYLLRYSPDYFKLGRPANDRAVSPPISYLSKVKYRILRGMKMVRERLHKTAEKYFGDFRNHNILMINQYSDMELCVSKRVAEIAAYYGINKSIIYVDYIGTLVAEKALGHCRSNPFSASFTVLFMGYAMPEKGFFMFMEALEEMEESMSKGISLKIASRVENQDIKKRIKKLSARFQSVTLYDGYTHDDFSKIMEDVNIGVVPPLWEDNLPQVAIEMIANGIPVLTGKNGGAQELNTHPMFCFENKADLNYKITKIMSIRSLLSDYWRYARTLVTMQQHIENLRYIYNI